MGVRRTNATTLALASAIAVVCAACVEEGELDASAGDLAAAAEVGEGADLAMLRAASIRIALQPSLLDLAEVNGGGHRVEVEGRFAEYRGLDGADPRVRTTSEVDRAFAFELDTCVASPERFEASTASPTAATRELALLDAGDMRVVVGDREVIVPLTLLPDLVSWASGVEYVLTDDAPIPPLAGADGPTQISIELAGGGPELGPMTWTFDAPALPEATSLDWEGDELVIDWAGRRGDGALLLELDAGLPGPGAVPIVCRLVDDGHAVIELHAIAGVDLTAYSSAVVTLRRVERGELDAGSMPLDWAIEARSQHVVERAR